MITIKKAHATMVDPLVVSAAVGLLLLTVLLVWLVVKAVQHSLTNRTTADTTSQSTVADPSSSSAGGDTLVFLYRHGCPACKPLFPVIDALALAHTGRVRKIVTTSDRQFVQANDIRRVPTLGILNSVSNKMVKLYEGPRTQQALESFGHDNDLW